LHVFDWFLIRTPLQNNRTSSSRSLCHLFYQEYQPSENATTSSSELATTECHPTTPFCFQRPSRRWWRRIHEMTPRPPLLPPSQPKSTVTAVDQAHHLDMAYQQHIGVTKTILGANHDHFFTGSSPSTTRSNTYLKYVALKYEKRCWAVIGQLFGEH
jgi:hypothetical protein